MLVQPAQRHYQGEAGRRYQQHKRGIRDSAIPWVARLRAEKLSPSVRPTDVVLEYGVGLGWNLAALKCRRRIGFDAADFLEPSLRALGIEYVAETNGIGDGTMDVVLCHHTLEHVLDPAAVLGEIRRLLAPGGKLLLFTPLEREWKYKRFRSGEPNHHLYSWNTQTLGNLAQELGFEVAEAGTGAFGYSRFAAVWASKLRLGETGFRCLRRLLHTIKPAREVRIIATKTSSAPSPP
ncbi:MAG: class I SAM-dependent methyltransferase [Verrucomicrobiota bacterium]|jgi:SAM-dependent methyltransferase